MTGSRRDSAARRCRHDLKASFAGYRKAARTLAGASHAFTDAHGVADLLTEEARRIPGA